MQKNQKGDKKNESTIYHSRRGTANNRRQSQQGLPNRNSPNLQLPEPQILMSSKAYRKSIVEPLIRRLKSLVRTVIAKSYEGWENYYRINDMNSRLCQERDHLRYEISKLKEINGLLREQNKGYRLLGKVLGKRRLNDLIEQARSTKKIKQRTER